MKTMVPPRGIPPVHHCPLPLAPDGCAPPFVTIDGRPAADVRLVGMVVLCDCGDYWMCGQATSRFGAWYRISGRRARRLERRAREAT